MTTEERQMTRDYLNRLIIFNRELNDVLERRDVILERAKNPSIQYSSDRVQTSNISDIVAKAVIEAEYLQWKADQMTDEYVSMKENLLSEIKQIRKEKYQKILEEKYVKEVKTSEIADRYDLTYRTCMNWLYAGEEGFFEVFKHKILCYA